MVLLSGLPCFWPTTSVTPPTSHTQRAKELLLEVAGHQGSTNSAAALTDLLQGATQVLLLLEFGVVLGGAKARAAAQAAAAAAAATKRTVASGGDVCNAVAAGGKAGAEEAVAKKRQYLRALTVLIVLLGQQLKHHVLQLLGVLSEAVECAVHEQVQWQAVGVWLVLIQGLAATAPELLDRVAAQAAVVLLPLVERDGSSAAAAAPAAAAVAGVRASGEGGAVTSSDVLALAADVLRELVVVHRPHVAHALKEMPPLPELPILKEVNAVLAEVSVCRACLLEGYGREPGKDTFWGAIMRYSLR